jgi:hypothetical protein
VVLGPNSVIDLPDGASFQFVEIQARSLAEHRAWLESLDQGMRRDALIPSGAQGAPRTATEISLAASQAYALLQSQAIQKASMFSSLLLHWCAITGEPVPLQQGPALLVEISTGIGLSTLGPLLGEGSGWAPDRRSGVAQSPRPALEVLDRNPGTDQGIQAVFQGFERRERLDLCGLRKGQIDGLDVLIKPIPNPPELRQQPPNPLFH